MLLLKYNNNDISYFPSTTGTIYRTVDIQGVYFVNTFSLVVNTGKKRFKSSDMSVRQRQQVLFL